ncbi:hypothetical protein BR141012304_20833 [Brucella inopinata]|nr:hypothetical protein BR141012304_20833 [Brucella inopinata]
MHSIAAVKPMLRGITAGQLLAQKFPPREFVIEPWLRTGESALIWAPTGVGKTWLTLSLSMAIAGGGRVWEWKAPKPRKVLIIDGEMNVQDLQERMAFLSKSKGVDVGQILHGSAKTTHAIRAELQRSKASAAELARRYGINEKTVLKWRKRRSVEDRDCQEFCA